MKPAPDLSIILQEIRTLRGELRASQQALLGVSEAASYLGLAEKTIRNSIGPRAVKTFPVRPVRVGGRVLFRRQDLEEFVRGLR